MLVTRHRLTEPPAISSATFQTAPIAWTTRGVQRVGQTINSTTTSSATPYATFQTAKDVLHPTNVQSATATTIWIRTTAVHPLDQYVTWPTVRAVRVLTFATSACPTTPSTRQPINA